MDHHSEQVGLGGTRTSNNWRSQPGQMDVLNTRYLWPEVGKYGIPCLEPTTFVPDVLAAWNSRAERSRAASTGAIHFFLDDYRFESIWRWPERYLSRILEVGAMLTPDFSIWRELPEALGIWQTYRNRWVGALFQSFGLEVIPTVSWSGPESYRYCFEGIPAKSVVAVSSVGVLRTAEARAGFTAGVTELVARLNPSTVLCYGSMPCELPVPVKEYPTFWQKRKGEQ